VTRNRLEHSGPPDDHPQESWACTQANCAAAMYPPATSGSIGTPRPFFQNSTCMLFGDAKKNVDGMLGAMQVGT
jgi:hypothetical protein